MSIPISYPPVLILTGEQAYQIGSNGMQLLSTILGVPVMTDGSKATTQTLSETSSHTNEVRHPADDVVGAVKFMKNTLAMLKHEHSAWAISLYTEVLALHEAKTAAKKPVVPGGGALMFDSSKTIVLEK